MSDVVLLLFMVALFGYVGYALWTAPAKPTNEEIDDVVRRCRLNIRALQRRTDPVWKDRGKL